MPAYTNRNTARPVISGGIFTDGYIEEYFSITINGGAYTISLANGTLQKIILAGNTSLTFPPTVAGMSFMLFCVQNGTGGYSLTWPSNVRWPSSTAPTFTSAANQLDKFVFTSDGVSWFGSNAGQNYTA